MGVLAELFVATHAEALTRADVLSTGEIPPPAPRADLTEIGPYDLELLGEIAARAVQFGTGDLEVAEVDLEHESLYRLPAFLCEVLVELAGAEDTELVDDVAQAWAQEDDMDVTAEDLAPVVRVATELAVTADRNDKGLYLWVRPV